MLAVYGRQPGQSQGGLARRRRGQAGSDSGVVVGGQPDARTGPTSLAEGQSSVAGRGSVSRGGGVGQDSLGLACRRTEGNVPEGQVAGCHGRPQSRRRKRRER